MTERGWVECDRWTFDEEEWVPVILFSFVHFPLSILHLLLFILHLPLSTLHSPSSNLRRHSQLRDYFLHLRDRGLAQSTIRTYLGTIEDLVTCLELGDAPPSTITTAQIRSYLLHLVEKDLAQTTIARRLGVIRRFFAFLLEEGHVEEDPTRPLPHIKDIKAEPRAISPSQVRKLFEAFFTYEEDWERAFRDEVIYHLIYACGLMSGEAVSIKVEDIDFHDALLKVEHDERERTIPLQPHTLELLRDYIREVQPERYLFPGRGEGHLSTTTVASRLKRYLDLAGLPEHVNPRILRSSMIAHYLHEGASMGSVQELLGHSDLSSTAHYQRFVPGEGEEEEPIEPPVVIE
ncbi:MAG: tyrosine-type recombinase/integrase [Chloroflexota bacterium]|nr:tyrosine-type recombinase/integrase [Chloroflexota bacterium]